VGEAKVKIRRAQIREGFLSDIPRIPGDSKAKIALSGVFDNGKSRSRCLAGVQTDKLTDYPLIPAHL
jgi:hypothetical protein